MSLFSLLAPNFIHPTAISPTPLQPAAPDTSTASCCNKDSVALSTFWLAPCQSNACDAQVYHCPSSQTHVRLSPAHSNAHGQPAFDDYAITWCTRLCDWSEVCNPILSTSWLPVQNDTHCLLTLAGRLWHPNLKFETSPDCHAYSPASHKTRQWTWSRGRPINDSYSRNNFSSLFCQTHNNLPLASLVRLVFTVLRHFTNFDRLIVLSSVSLHRYRRNRRIHNLTSV